MPDCDGHAGIFNVPALGMPRLAAVICDGGTGVGGVFRRDADGDGDGRAFVGRGAGVFGGRPGELALGPADTEVCAAARSDCSAATARQPPIVMVSPQASTHPSVRCDMWTPGGEPMVRIRPSYPPSRR